MNDLKFTTAGDYMEDERCCGTGSCIINNEGECWCGQRWDGEKMSPPYFINESGLRVNAVTGELIKDRSTNSQNLAP